MRLHTQLPKSCFHSLSLEIWEQFVYCRKKSYIALQSKGQILMPLNWKISRLNLVSKTWYKSNVFKCFFSRWESPTGNWLRSQRTCRTIGWNFSLGLESVPYVFTLLKYLQHICQKKEQSFLDNGSRFFFSPIAFLSSPRWNFYKKLRFLVN